MSQPDFQSHLADYGMPNSSSEPRSYYGYPPLSNNYHYPAYRDQFGSFQSQTLPHYPQPPVNPTHSYPLSWPLKPQQPNHQNSNEHLFPTNQLPQQSLKPDSTSPQPPVANSVNEMELAHLNVFHSDMKSDPLHLGMSILNLPTTQANQPSVPAPLLNQLNTSSSMDSNITLWQFLLEILTSNEHPDLIQWTNNEGEFKLLDAEAVARLWGVRKGKHQMNYDKLSRALRYYYDKNIIKKVNGQKFVYRFVVPSDSLGSSNTDMLSYSMQRNMGINQPLLQSRNSNSLLPPSSTSLPRPHPTNHANVNTASSTADQRFVRRTNSSAPTIKTDDSLSRSTSRPLTVTNTTSTPSPINSTCSPGSVGSSSGVSSAGTSTSNLSDVYHHGARPHPTVISTSGSSSRPSSTASTVTHQQHHQPNHRKRKREDNGVCIEKIKIEPPSSYYNNNANENLFLDAQSPTNGTGLSRRKSKPVPLDLTAVSNVNNNMPSINNNTMNNNTMNNNTMNNNTMNSLVAAASPLFQHSPALLNIYAATLSANFMQNQPSPLSTFTAAALASPIHFAAAIAASPTLNPSNNNLSMFGNSLSALTTPIPTRTPQQTQNTSQSHGQFFQFPPPSQTSAHFALAALLRSPGLQSPFLSAMGLSTPTAQTNGTKFNLSPNDTLKTPIPPIREI